uniref:SUEL-type lectin domain-containing protein n=1 Tax=Sparus aurata TaxID=8175 RepID=A0A671WIZ0_SPAAU
MIAPFIFTAYLCFVPAARELKKKILRVVIDDKLIITYNLFIFLCSLSVYLHTILKNHTAHACEGETLVIECPSRTSVSVLSAFYGRRVPNQHLCPSANSNTTGEEDTECTSPKVVSECQDRRSCHIPVFSPVFGQDPCPLTTKYLLVAYKCRPGKLLRLVCENERLRLTCKNATVLAIYSASFGHLLHGSPYCPQEPGSHCLSPSALRKVSRRCHGRANCSVLADTQTFGDPCFPGTRKHLRVSFTYFTHGESKAEGSLRFLLHAADFDWRLSSDPSRLQVDGTLAPPTGLPERVALYFVSGICAGLVFLLCLFGLRSTIVRDVKELVSEVNEELKPDVITGSKAVLAGKIRSENVLIPREQIQRTEVSTDKKRK